VLDSAVLGNLDAKLFEVRDHFVKSVCGLSLEVLKVDKNSKFAGLTAESGQRLVKCNLPCLCPWTSANKPCRKVSEP
jgi:hypothetical protein